MAIYCDDQGPSRFIEDDVQTQPFETVKQKALREFGSAVLDVSSFQRRYNEGVFEETEWMAFIDDFSDLK